MSAQGRLCPACGAELQRSWQRVVLAVLALVLVATGYYVVTRVVTIRRIERQIARLPQASLAALLPKPTPTFVPTPTPTTEPRPTPTRIPTTTSVPSPMVVVPMAMVAPSATPTARLPTATPTTPLPTARPPTATPTTPLPTATPSWRLAAIELVAPADGAEFTGADAPIELSWKPAMALGEGEGYEVRVRYQAGGQVQQISVWVSGTSWRVPAELYGKRDPAKPAFEWQVRVMRLTGSRADGSPEGVLVSAPGTVWGFSWR